MHGYYYGEIVGIENDRIVYVNSPHCYGEHLNVLLPEIVEVGLPGIMSRRPNIGDMIEYICLYGEEQECFGIFVRFQNEPIVYLGSLLHDKDAKDSYVEDGSNER